MSGQTPDPGPPRPPLVLPPTRRERRRRQRTLIIGGVVAVLISLAIVGTFLMAANRNGDIQLGDKLFNAGGAVRMAKAIDRDGPILFPDPLKRSAGRNLYVQHLGSDWETGWLAFEAQVDDPRCQVVWQRTAAQFRDPCTGRTYPADGGGLTHYPAQVQDGRVVIDLRFKRD